ncbi:XRE family transcriptional regulator [Salmonella enterica]|nr:hypothetical protein [Salmonella enterica subsp. enterica serovar Javiana]EGL8313675.1 XRE family transcriptional regulator [Salmonella enterica]
MMNSDKKLKCGTALERLMNKNAADRVCDGAKKRLMDSIVSEIEDKGYTNSEVCSMTCVPSSRVKDLKEKRGDGFQFETLLRMAITLKLDVEISAIWNHDVIKASVKIS